MICLSQSPLGEIFDKVVITMIVADTDKEPLVKCDLVNSVARITMMRPKMHNAFNGQMLVELTGVFNEIADMGTTDVRVVVITGKGESFCAGADLEWMRGDNNKLKYSEAEISSKLIANCMRALYNLPQPSIARINGGAFGGGLGLIAASDIAIAINTAKFSGREVRHGLAPGCIAPYVMMRVGRTGFKRLFLTGEEISADEAMGYKLVDIVVSPDELDSAIDEVIGQLKLGGPEALMVCKKIIRDMPYLGLEGAIAYGSETTACKMIGDEGQEGMEAFSEKRKPNWIK